MLIRTDAGQLPQRESVLEVLMRFTPAAVSLAVLLAVSSSISHGQKPTSIDSRSVQWAERGAAAYTAGNFNGATDAYETALALDPRNSVAFVGLARIARSQDLPGKAIRYYDEALDLDPKDVTILQQQGVAMLEKGAVESARSNLARIKESCKSRCTAADELAAAIASNSAQPQRIVATSELKPVPTGAPLKD
ncbi:MAG TPA: tetratricopeptide repeat protein [Sphingobium sp.]|uniref:tetratricopeptide repeat protein n=1 Tax=Sphingobium sp. TaxID=1912891 RepID=UPI002ED0A5E1